MSRVLNLLLTHQKPAEIGRLLAWWRHIAPEDQILLIYGGSNADFETLSHPQKIFVEDPRLRTSDHQRQRQSYSGIYATAARWLHGRDFTHVYFAEYDHLPIVADLHFRLLERQEAEGADVLGHGVLRVDRTSQAHYLYHQHNPGFAAYWRSMSRRTDKEVVLSMFGTGSFWTRAAFDAVGGTPEPFPTYLEIWLPTVAHHLGFRVRDLGEQNPYIRNLGEMQELIGEARKHAAWTIHPVKQLWHSEANCRQLAGLFTRA